MDLAALADFNLVASQGGFGRASRASGRPKATLSRRVAELESSLGVRLFERGSRSLQLTEEGRTLHAHTQVLLTEITADGAQCFSVASLMTSRVRLAEPAARPYHVGLLNRF